MECKIMPVCPSPPTQKEHLIQGPFPAWEELSHTDHLNFISTLSGRYYYVQLTSEKSEHSRPSYLSPDSQHRGRRTWIQTLLDSYTQGWFFRQPKWLLSNWVWELKGSRIHIQTKGKLSTLEASPCIDLSVPSNNNSNNKKKKKGKKPTLNDNYINSSEDINRIFKTT